MNERHSGSASLAVLGIAGTAAWLLLPRWVEAAPFEVDTFCDSLADGDADDGAVRGRPAGAGEIRYHYTPISWNLHGCFTCRPATPGVDDGRVGPWASFRRTCVAWPLAPRGRAPPAIRP